ncbi:MAG TPA: hypothetical protein VFU89_06630 [Rhabdochlamydiaceae bacterium]|nr:hypothetical protein [Rhabdochlamydiaceae bacterium]
MKKFLIVLGFFFAVERFCHFQTGGFILSKMVLKNVSHHHLGLSETLTFIGAGKQFYAFETADHQHVVKFMKYSGRRPLPWLEKFPASWTKHTLSDRAKKLAKLRSSSALALKYLSSEAALTSYPLPQTLILIDKLGIAHTVDRSQTEYIVQKKAVPFTAFFDQNPLKAETLISSYLRAVESQCKKGISNLDPLVDRNCGVTGTHVILMDIGSFVAHPRLIHKADILCQIFIELLPLRQWLKKKHPEHVAYFDRSVQKLLSN